MKPVYQGNKPLDFYESLLIAALCTLPVWGGFDAWLVWRRKLYIPTQQRSDLLCILTALLLPLIVCVGGFFYVNAAYDDSSAQAYTVPLTGKHIVHARHDDIYYVEATSPTYVPSGKNGSAGKPAPTDDTESFEVTPELYATVLATDTVEITVRKGYFHLPWRESYHVNHTMAVK